MLGRSVLNFREHGNLDWRRSNVGQTSPRPKRFKEYRLEGAPNYQPARDAKLSSTCAGRQIIISLPGTPIYQPARDAKLSACPGRQIISLPGTPNYLTARDAHHVWGRPWSALSYSLGLKLCRHFHSHTHFLQLFCITMQIKVNQTYVVTNHPVL
jgi:hypothetical protein